MVRNVCIFILAAVLTTCSNKNERRYTTTGTVEAYKIDIRSAAPGKIIYNNIPEGLRIQQGHLFTVIDTTDLHLQKEQLFTQIDGISLQMESLESRETELRLRLEFLNKQCKRLEKLVASDGVSQEKLDEIRMERDVTRAKLGDIPVQNRSLINQRDQLQKQIALLDYRIREAVVEAPSNGVVLQRYVESGERVQPGHLLATVGLMDTVWVMMYIPEPRLADVSTGNSVSVMLDGRPEELSGIVEWIAPEAEFTPKTVYTEDTRTSLTYGVRVRIPNPDDLLKIGMPVTLNL